MGSRASGLTMKTNRWLGLAAIAAATLDLAGCVYEDENAPKFKAGQGQDPGAADAAYPDGPYGFSPGSRLPNLQFLSYPDSVGRPGELRIVKLSDFYNPTGTEVFPPELGYHGEGLPKPRAMVLLISAVWCGPCRNEAANILPGEYDHWKPLGGHFMAVLTDGTQPGTPVTIPELQQWTIDFNPRYTMGMDPSEYLMSWFEPAYPGNMIVRTADMQIMKRVTGVPPSDEDCGTIVDVNACNELTADGLCRWNGSSCVSDFWATFAEVAAGSTEPLDGAE
jgi:hypothetical protein